MRSNTEPRPDPHTMEEGDRALLMEQVELWLISHSKEMLQQPCCFSILSDTSDPEVGVWVDQYFPPDIFIMACLITNV